MKRALLVGVNKYPGEKMDLENCENDIKKWSDLLMGERFGFTRENIRLLAHPRATKSEVLIRLDWLTWNARDGEY